MSVVVESGLVEDRDETLLGARFPIRRVHRGQQGSAERSLFATPGEVPCLCLFKGRPRFGDLAERSQDAAQVNPGERRQPYISGRLGLVDRQSEGGSTSVVVTGLALRSSKTGQLIRLCLPEAEMSGRFRGATRWTTASSKRCWMRANSPSTASARTCSHGSSTVRSQCWT